MTTPTIRAALERLLIVCDTDESNLLDIDPDQLLCAMSDARAALKAEPVGEGPSERDVAEWINRLPLWHGATRDELPGIVLRAFAHWGRPAARPAPAPPAEALAARPLLEQMARLQHSHHSNPWSQMLTLSSRAAAWLEENSPGQPVAIEPPTCPIPGACSCVEPAPVVVPVAIVRFEFEVLDEHDQTVAGGDAPTLEEAAREGRHYLSQYQKDEPCTLELRRVEVLNPDAISLPQAGEVEG